MISSTGSASTTFRTKCEKGGLRGSRRGPNGLRGGVASRERDERPPSAHPKDVSNLKLDVCFQVTNLASAGPPASGGPNLVVLGMEPMDSQTFEHGQIPAGMDRINVDS